MSQCRGRIGGAPPNSPPGGVEIDFDTTPRANRYRPSPTTPPISAPRTPLSNDQGTSYLDEIELVLSEAEAMIIALDSEDNTLSNDATSSIQPGVVKPELVENLRRKFDSWTFGSSAIFNFMDLTPAQIEARRRIRTYREKIRSESFRSMIGSPAIQPCVTSEDLWHSKVVSVLRRKLKIYDVGSNIDSSFMDAMPAQMAAKRRVLQYKDKTKVQERQRALQRANKERQRKEVHNILAKATFIRERSAKKGSELNAKQHNYREAVSAADKEDVSVDRARKRALQRVRKKTIENRERSNIRKMVALKKRQEELHQRKNRVRELKEKDLHRRRICAVKLAREEAKIDSKQQSAEIPMNREGGSLQSLTTSPRDHCCGVIPLLGSNYADRSVGKVVRRPAYNASCHAPTHISESVHQGTDPFEKGVRIPLKTYDPREFEYVTNSQ